jgi:plasmid replication initiation protein
MASLDTTLTNTYVITSNDLVRAKYSYTLWEKRIFLYMISQLRREDTEFKPMRLYIKDLIKFFGGQSNNDYHIIRNIPDSLAKKPFYVPFTSNDGGKKWAIINILSYGIQPDESEQEADGAFIEMKFNSDMMPYLLELKEKFTKYNIRNVTELKSVYSIRIFELLKENEYRKDGFEVKVDELKEMLFLKAKDNNGTELYPLYADFKKRVLLKAQSDLSESCDISFEFKEIKDGKKVVAIYFKTYPNDKTGRFSKKGTPSVTNPIFDLDDTVVNAALFKEILPLVQGWGISVEVLQLLIETQPEDAIRNGLEYTMREYKSGRIKDNAAGYFINAVKKRYTNAAFENDKKQAQRQTERRQKEQQKRELHAELEDLLDEYNQRVNEIIREITATDENITLKAIMNVKQDNKAYFKVKQIDPDMLSVDDFRQDRVLRSLVIQQIQLLNSESFIDLDNAYKPRINNLERQIKMQSV